MGLYVNKKKDGTVVVGSAETVNGRTVTKPGDPPSKHHFGVRWVTNNLNDGTVTMTKGRITVGSATWKVVRTPGGYCLDCGERVGDGPAHTVAQAKQRDEHRLFCEEGGASGFEVIHYYDCELEN